MRVILLIILATCLFTSCANYTPVNEYKYVKNSTTTAYTDYSEPQKSIVKTFKYKDSLLIQSQYSKGFYNGYYAVVDNKEVFLDINDWASKSDSNKRNYKAFVRPEGIGAYFNFGQPVLNGFGFKFKDYYLDFGFAGYDFPNKAQYDYAIPHTDYRTIKSTGDGLTFSLGYVFPINNKLEITPMLGAFIIPTNYLDVSNATGWTYKNREESETKISYGAMLVYNIYQLYDIGVKYNNVTGVSLVIGLHQFK